MRCLLLFLTWLIPSIALALPDASRPANVLVNPNNSIIYGDSEQDQLYWVMPPGLGELRISNVEAFVTTSECENWKSREERIRGIEDSLTALELQKTELEREYIQALRRGEEDEAGRIQSALEAISTFITNNYESLRAAEADLTGSGGYYQILANIEWAESIETLRTNNPDYEFLPISVRDIVPYFSVPGVGSSDRSLLILDYSVSGGGEILGALTDSIAIDLEVSKRVACIFEHPAWFGVDDLNPTFSASLIYNFDLLFGTEIRAAYDFWSLYQFLVKSGKKGGFFSTSSYRETVQSTEFKSLFEIEFTAESADNPIALETKLQIEDTVRQYFLATLADTIANAAGLQNNMAEAPTGSTGAEAAAEGLAKACPNNEYCVAANIGLNVLNSVFGSSKSWTEYRNEISGQQVWRFVSDDAVRSPGGVNYVSE